MGWRITIRIWLAAVCLALVPAQAVRAASADIKVMSFNVRLPIAQDGVNAWEHRRAQAAEMIAREMPDIMATQELHKPQGDYLLQKLRGYSWFGIDRRGGHADEHMGVFYRRDRFNLLELGNFWLSDTPTVPGSITGGHPYPRMVTWGLFESRADGRRFYLLNTHFPHRDVDGEARRKAAAQIAAWIATLPAETPVILAGDFNALPESPVHGVLAAELADARLTAPIKRGPEETFHAFSGKADRRIDWIFARGLRATSVETITSNRDGRYPSDHFPVVVVLAWPNGG